MRVSFYFVAEEPGRAWNPILRGSPVERIRVVPPSADRFMPIPDEVQNMIDEVSHRIYVVGAEFTDAAGNRWERDPPGCTHAALA